MGMDLIGFCYVGKPRLRFAPSKVPWSKACAKLTKKLRKYENEPLEELDFENSGEQRVYGALASAAGFSGPSEATTNALVKKLTPKLVQEALSKILLEFERVWNTGGDDYRRWMTRTAKVGRGELRIGVCACESWGDAPDNDRLWQLCEEVSWMGEEVLSLKDALGVW